MFYFLLFSIRIILRQFHATDRISTTHRRNTLKAHRAPHCRRIRKTASQRFKATPFPAKRPQNYPLGFRLAR